MPIYEYVCGDCKTPFEKIVLKRDEPIECPSCGGRKAKMQLSVFRTAGSRESSSGSSGSGSCGCTPSGCGCR